MRTTSLIQAPLSKIQRTLQLKQEIAERERELYDMWGQPRHVSPETKKKIAQGVRKAWASR
jgi:hypothetical protein